MELVGLEPTTSWVRFGRPLPLEWCRFPGLLDRCPSISRLVDATGFQTISGDLGQRITALA
jgi:hypothetical protein